MYLKTMKLRDIIPYERNPRINDQAVPAVMESIQRDGYRNRIEVDENGVILSGHTRLKALKKLGWKEAEVEVHDDMTEDQKRDYRVRDNATAELAEWDYDLLPGEIEGLDFSSFDFGFPDTLDTEEKEAAEDHYDPQPPEDPQAKRGDVYRLGRHRLMCGDSTQQDNILRLMGGHYADLLLTDPPYNVNLFGGGIDTKKRTQHDPIANDAFKSTEEYTAFLTDAFKAAFSVMAAGAPFYVWYASKYHTSNETALERAGLPTRQQLIWVKSQIILGHSDYHWQHEPCLYGWKEGPHFFTDSRKEATVIDDAKPQDLKKMNKAELLEYAMALTAQRENAITTAIREDKPLVADLHPTMKPIKLFDRLIRNSCPQGKNVLDIFGGSGTAIMAAEQNGRRAFVMEFEPAYVDTIIDRWEKFTGGKAELIAQAQ